MLDRRAQVLISKAKNQGNISDAFHRSALLPLLPCSCLSVAAPVTRMKGKIFTTLFALPFLGVGVWMGWSIGSTIYDASRMQQWDRVEARLISAGYETRSGDDADTYLAYAHYSYTFNGGAYTGDRVNIAAGADNIGDYQRDMGNALSTALARGETVTVYVNPAMPWESVIDPGVR